MKLVMDEKLKHRLIGLAVIISLAAIFAPAMMKKSGQRLDGNFTVNIKLPPKPIAPNVVSTDEKELFQTIKITKASMPDLAENTQPTTLVKAESIKANSIKSQVETYTQTNPFHLAMKEAAQNTAKQSLIVAEVPEVKKVAVVALKQKSAPTKVLVKPTPRKVAVSSANKRALYAVQLASFTQQTNAQALVTRLRAKGFKANFTKVAGKQGTLYKVFAGYSPSKPDVVRVKTKIASAMQLNGFIVHTGVS